MTLAFKSTLVNAAISAAFGLLAGGFGWMVQSAVHANSAQAVYAEKLAEHQRVIDKHDQAISEIPSIKVLMAEISANQRALADLVERMDRQLQSHPDDVRRR